MESRQVDKLCPIRNGPCSAACTFYVPGENDRFDTDAYCQLNAYFTNHIPNNKSAVKKAKPLLEGSDKK